MQRSNVNVLEATLRQTRDRFSAGEVTRTDVAQAESRLAGGRSQLSVAESNYVTSRANYRQVIGVDPPARLTPAMPVDRLSPRTLDGAVARGRTEHPLITTAMYNVDVAQMQVKVAEGALYPTVSVHGNVQKTFGSTSSLAVIESLAASVAGQVSVPIYQGGAEYATIRQSKETLGQRRLDLDTARDQVQQHGHPGLGAARCRQGADQFDHGAGRRRPRSPSTACARRPASASAPRSTCSMPSRIWSMRASPWSRAQRDRVVASYTVLAATGALSPQVLGLKIATLRPDGALSSGARRWGGVRTPDGR